MFDHIFMSISACPQVIPPAERPREEAAGREDKSTNVTAPKQSGGERIVANCDNQVSVFNVLLRPVAVKLRSSDILHLHLEFCYFIFNFKCSSTQFESVPIY